MLRVKSGLPGRINHITLLVFTYDNINFNRLSNASGSSRKNVMECISCSNVYIFGVFISKKCFETVRKVWLS